MNGWMILITYCLSRLWPWSTPPSAPRSKPRSSTCFWECLKRGGTPRPPRGRSRPSGWPHRASPSRLHGSTVGALGVNAAGFFLRREERSGLTWQEGDDWCVSVGPFGVVHHDLGGALAGVTAHRGPDADVTTPVNYCRDLPVGFVHLVATILKLDLWYCDDNRRERISLLSIIHYDL